MEQEQKDKLLKYLCAALPYGVKCKGTTEELVIDFNDDIVRKNVEIIDALSMINLSSPDGAHVTLGRNGVCDIDTIKPYLRPMSSMTEEERRELNAAIFGDSGHKEFFTFSSEPSGIIYNGNDNCCFINIGDSTIDRLTDWLLEHHFDFRGLIPKGAAIVAPEGMYETN